MVGQKDHYARLLKENASYWADVKLPGGKWATRADRSKRAKLARHRRYINKRGNAVFRECYWNDAADAEDMDAEEDSDVDGFADEDDFWED